MNHTLKNWETVLLTFLPLRFDQPVKIHLHPWWNATDECHILIDRFVNDLIQFGFPVFNTIGFIR